MKPYPNTIKMDERKKLCPRVKPTTKLKSKKEKYIKTTPIRSRSFEALKGYDRFIEPYRINMMSLM